MKKSEYIRVYILKFLSFFLLKNNVGLELNQLQKILIVGHYGIGDTIFFFPVIRTLILNHPVQNITVITHSDIIQEILQINFPGIEVLCNNLSKEKLQNKIKFFWKIRRKRYQVFIANFLGLKKDYIQLGLFCQIPYRIGHIFNNEANDNKYEFFFNHRIQVTDAHYIENNLNLLTPFHLVKSSRNTTFILDKSSDHIGKSYIKKFKNKIKILVQPYSSVGPMKNWPEKYYRELILQIKRKYESEIILIGSPSEKEYINNMFEDFDIELWNICGQFSLFEMASIIKYSDLFIGNDGGLGKISIALNTPTITIWGSSDYNRAKAWQRGHIDLYKKADCAPCVFLIEEKNKSECDQTDKFKCFKSIQVQDVFKEVEKIIG